MGYLKLKKASGAFDLIPSDSILYVIGSEGTAEATAGAADGTSPSATVVYSLPAAATKAFASKIILGSNDQVLATAGLIPIMELALNNAILKSMQEPGAIVEVDFSKMSKGKPAYLGDGTVVSAAPFEYAL